MAIKDWSLTANSNTTIDSINIAEGCPFANMNNAVRAVMTNVREEVAAQGTDVTAGAISTISGASQFKYLTGAATISAFDTAVTGLYREMVASSTLTLAPTTALGLTRYSSNISLPPGSLVRARSLGAGNWVAHLARGDGLPPVRFWEEEQAADVAAATIVDVSSAIPFAVLTGNTTIEGFATAVTGAYRELRASGAPLLKHDGTSNIVQGGANVALAAGDVLRSRSLGAGNWSHKIDYASTAGATGSLPDRNVIVKNNAATPNSKMDVTADQVVLQTAGGAAHVATSVSVTIDIAASAGANALDTGSEASNTWYYIWLIYNGSAVAGLFSTSATSPTMPSGYTYKALVGAVRNNASSNFLKTWGIDRRIKQERVNVLAATAVSVANTLQSLAISSAVPAAAKTVSGILATDAAQANHAMAIAGDANGVGMQIGASFSTLGSQLLTVFYKGSAFHDVPLITAQTVYWTASDTSAASRIDVTGFTL